MIRKVTTLLAGNVLAHIVHVVTILVVVAGFFEPADYPARSTVAVSALALGASVEIECTALHTE